MRNNATRGRGSKQDKKSLANRSHFEVATSVLFCKRSTAIACLSLGAALSLTSLSHGQIAIDGTLDSAYGSPLAIGQNATANDSATGNTVQYAAGAEIDATYATIATDPVTAAPALYVFLAGNVDNNHHVDLFIQTGTGGKTVFGSSLATNSNPANVNRLSGTSTGTNRGLQLNAAFAPNYVFLLSPNGEDSTAANSPVGTQNTNVNLYMDDINLNTATAGGGADFNPGTERTVYSSSTYPSLQFSLNNSNTAGVTTTTATGQTAVSTGLEYKIDLSDITEVGQTISTIKISAIVTDLNQMSLTNQITGLPANYIYNFGSMGTTQDVGEPTYGDATDFDNQNANLFVTVPTPEPTSLSLLALGGCGI